MNIFLELRVIEGLIVSRARNPPVQKYDDNFSDN